MTAASTNSGAVTTNTHARPDEDIAPTYMAILFMLSLIFPILIRLGPVLLLPHRIVLLVFFIPCMMRLWGGRAGPIIPADWLMLGSAIWAIFALAFNHGLSVVEAMGIHMIEFYGAYILGRVAIRSADDFRRLVKCMFFIALLLLPLAATESILKRNFVLEALPNSIGIVTAPFRWGMRRAQTLFTHPIHFGVFASIGMGLFWYCLVPASRRLIAIPVVIASTIFSLSSGALICLVVQFFLILWELVLKHYRSRWKTFAGVAAALFILIETFTNRGFFLLLVTFASFNTGSAYNRILIWKFGKQNVIDNPIFGLGFREWERAPWMSTSADNFWLLIAMMFGLPTFIFFASAIVVIFWRIFKTTLTDPFDIRCRLGYMTAMGGLIIGGGTVHYWTAMMAVVLFFFGAGNWISTGGARMEAAPDGGEPELAPAQGNRYTRFSHTPSPHTPKPARPIAAKPPSYSRNPTLHERQKAMRAARASKKT